MITIGLSKLLVLIAIRVNNNVVISCDNSLNSNKPNLLKLKNPTIFV